MILLVFGFLLIVIGVFNINFPALAQVLKEYDLNQYNKLGKPTGFNIMDNGKTLGLFSWVLNKGYETSNNAQILTIASKAYARALLAKYTMIGGVVLMIVGLAYAIF
jgi:hypothetical protein